MENNEVMVNEEVIEAVEEVATSNTYNGIVVLSSGIVTLGAGYLLVKKVIIPLVDKIKAKKEAKRAEAECESTEDFEESNEK